MADFILYVDDRKVFSVVSDPVQFSHVIYHSRPRPIDCKMNEHTRTVMVGLHFGFMLVSPQIQIVWFDFRFCRHCYISTCVGHVCWNCLYTVVFLT